MDCRDMRLLRQHATAIYLLPHERAVARVSPLSSAEALGNTVRLVRWLLAQGLRATEPLEVEQPIRTPNAVLTLWRYYPQSDATPPARYLGELLRHLHDLPQPPVPLHAYQPLEALSQMVDAARTLPEATKDWLQEAIDARLSEYRSLEFGLGIGLIHGDAYPGNTLWDGDQVRLGDWDEAAIGPREIDLANTYQGVRFGRTQSELEEFAAAYGSLPADPRALGNLTAIRDLHTLGAFIRRADVGDEEAQRQLAHRLDTLQRGEQAARWDVY